MIVVSQSASPSEAFAAREFQKYWDAATGAHSTVSGDSGAGRCVWIGRAAVPQPLHDDLGLDGLGDDGLIIKTLHWRGGDHLAIVGGERRGTLYGVYEFFERYMGIRWLTPGVVYIPPDPLPLPASIDYRYVPPVFYRDISQRTFMTDPEFATIHRMNGRFVNSDRIGGSGDMPDHLGGKIDYANGFAGWGHTFHSFIDPNDYFDAHPEYFSEISGNRQREPTQLCLTNPDVVRIVTDKARAMLRAEPNARVISISQMDWEYFCTCAQCRSLDQREGTTAGSLVLFINTIADAIAGEFPDAFVDTYAYMYTQTPPKTLRVRDNVIIRLCTFNNDFSKPVTVRRNERNRRFTKDLEGWCRIAENVFIYDYLPNFNSFQQPNPNLHTIQPNYEYYVKRGVKGLYAQGNPESPNSEFEHLRAYVAAKVMWDPSTDANAVMREFITLYYGEAAPYIAQYIELITKRANDYKNPITLFAPLDWMDYDTVVRSDELFRLAFMNVHEPKYVERLREAYLPIRYAALVCKPRVTWDGMRATLERPGSLTFEQYWDLLRYHGVTHLNDYPIETLRERLRLATPPRAQALTIHVLENSRYKVWVAPEHAGAVVRWRDKSRRREWLNGFEDVASGRGDQHDLVFVGDQLLVDNDDAPTPFEVVDSSTGHIRLVAKLENGMSVMRVIRLRDRLEFKTTLFNHRPGTHDVRVKTHPEFRIQKNRQPELWIRSDTGWVAMDSLHQFLDGDISTGLWEAPATRMWAVAMKPQGPFLVNTFSGPYTRMHYQSSLSGGRAAVDLLADDIRLGPGKGVTLRSEYAIASELP